MTLNSALVGVAVSSHRRILILVAIVATAFFAMLDFRYRTVQLRHAARSTKVELRIVPGFEFTRYQGQGAAKFVWRVSQANYLTTSMFYIILVTVLLLVWIFT